MQEKAEEEKSLPAHDLVKCECLPVSHQAGSARPSLPMSHDHHSLVCSLLRCNTADVPLLWCGALRKHTAIDRQL